MSGIQSQTDLFGNPAPAAAGPVRLGRRETNDLDLIHHIAGNASRGLYVLVGTAERVYVRTDGPDGDRVARVPRYEEDAVHQLLHRRWLTRGATHHLLTYGAASLSGTAVLTTRTARNALARWQRRQQPPPPTGGTRPGHR